VKLKTLAIAITLALFWMGTVVSSYANGEEGRDKNVVAEKTATASKEDKKDEKATSKPSVDEQIYLLNDKVHKLEELVEKQQKMIEMLTKASESNVPAVATTTANLPNNASTSVVATSTNNVPSSTTSQPQALAEEQQKKLDALTKAFGSLTFSGDIRFRYDGQFDQGFDAKVGSPDRNRIRARGRFQLLGQINKNIDWGVRLATGSFTNPSSTNQTATDFFNRKPVGFDRYFIRYDSKPEKGLGVSLTAGKFDYTFKRTELTFDNDIQPEGASETVYYKGDGLLKDARLIAFQLPFNEVSGGKDSALFGGQAQATVGKGKLAFTGALTYLNFNQVDAIAKATGKPNTQVGGGLELSTTNRVRRDAMGNIIGFVTNYNILDVIGEVRYTKFEHFPITLTLDYARNMSDKLDLLRERNAYWVEFKVGQTKEKGDVEFTYTFDRVQQDAVLSVFSFDDFLATNSRNNRVTGAYTLNKNVYFQFIGLFSQRFNVAKGVDNRTAKRFQLDINYRF
jgi:hypothetical protein